MNKTIEDRIINISDRILTILLNYKKQHPKFTFSLRQRDSPQSKDKRLEKGFWFQGSNYIFVPLFRKGDNARKIKTIGFVVGFSKDKEAHNNFVEISFKSGSSSSEKAFHTELAEYFNVKLNKENYGYYSFPNNDYEENIKFYLGDFRNKALELLEKYSLTNQFLISENQFDKALNKIIEIKDRLKILPTEKKDMIDASNIQKSNIKMPLNQILYGPPGTGKTYSLQKDYFPQFTIEESILTKETYIEGVVAELNWWQVITVALLDLISGKVRNIYEHEIVQAKERLSSSQTVMPTIWGQLQSHTVLNCKYVNVEKRSEPLYFTKDEKSNWSIDNEALKNNYPQAEEILSKIKNFKPQSGKLVNNYEFITFHQSFSYEDFIEGIKPKLDEGDGELNFEIKDGVFKKICTRAENDPQNNYAIFIDEINRGNISAIFGELITLIESDKRLGQYNQLKVKLPYSKKDFGVPSNLYIIGTMNTADRSVESLDTALRRRFSFVEMMPDLEVLNGKEINGISLKELLSTVNKRVEILLGRDHIIGHSYFIDVKTEQDIRNTFKDSIIPLLQEYFYGDYEKIGMILGNEFFDVTEKYDKNLFANFPTQNYPDPGSLIRLRPIDKNFDISKALNVLLKKEKSTNE